MKSRAPSPSLRAFSPGFAAVSIALGVATASCSGAPATSSTTGAAATAGTGGTGGTGGSTTSTGAGGTTSTDTGPPTIQVCVSSPVPAAFPGTDDCPAPVPGVADTLDDALQAGGLTRCEVRLLPDDVALSGWPDVMLVDKHRLPDFAALQRGPLRLPGYARETRDFLDKAVTSANPVSGTIAALSARRGHLLDNACADLTAFEPDAKDTTPLATAVLLLDANQGKPGDEAAVKAAAAALPLDLQQKLARIVGAIDHAATEVKASLGTSNATDLKYLARSFSLYIPALFVWDTSAGGIAKLDAVDVDRMSDAAATLAKTIEAQELGKLPDAKFAPFELTTPLGTIVIHDSSNDTYASGGPADTAVLLFDLGGDDTYEAPAGASDDKHPVSIAIDVRGADHYQYKIKGDVDDTGLLPSDGKGRYHTANPPDKDYGPISLSRVGRQGAGLAGIGMLLDLGKENDTYQSLTVSQGFASMGIGILYDAGGDDTYAAEAGAQGSATYGIAALIDASGKDTYQSFTYSQGFGGARGAAALLDAAGDDTYYCDPGDPALGGHPLYFSPQLPGKGNSSMSQGTAQGRRPQDNKDASYMAGGIGILRDLHGSDHYTASVFAQAAGYWQGIGMLLDGDGDDTYNAKWYIQGSSAHFSLSVFLDESGNDKYNPDFPPAATSIGLGHDFSASLHLDLGGDDEYHAPGLSLGSGNINGIGLLVNVGGNDTYDSAGDPTLGAGNYSSEAPFGDPRQDAPTIGIFVDAGGTDTYTVAGTKRPLDDTTWSYEPQPYPDPMMVTTEHGCSADKANGTVTLP